MEEPTVLHEVEFLSVNALRILDTDGGIILRLHNAEISMTPEAARNLAGLLLKLAEKHSRTS